MVCAVEAVVVVDVGLSVGVAGECNIIFVTCAILMAVSVLWRPVMALLFFCIVVEEEGC